MLNKCGRSLEGPGGVGLAGRICFGGPGAPLGAWGRAGVVLGGRVGFFSGRECTHGDPLGLLREGEFHFTS